MSAGENVIVDESLAGGCVIVAVGVTARGESGVTGGQGKWTVEALRLMSSQVFLRQQTE